MNFFKGLGIIFIGGFGGALVKYAMPLIVTGTDIGSEIMTTFVPVVLFFSLLILGLMVMIGRKKINPPGPPIQ